MDEKSQPINTTLTPQQEAWFTAIARYKANGGELEFNLERKREYFIWYNNLPVKEQKKIDRKVKKVVKESVKRMDATLQNFSETLKEIGNTLTDASKTISQALESLGSLVALETQIADKTS